jgi:EmrB/QacA subfamily drug resistance transporter
VTGRDRSPAHRWYVLALLGTGFFMTILDATSLLAALPSIDRDLHLDGQAVQWVVTAYTVAFSGPLLLCGRAADQLGRRRIFLAGMALRVLASLWCGLAPSAGILVAARALQGISAAIIAPAALSMVMSTFTEGAERNKALGVWGGIGGFGATAGLLLGGLLTDTLGWPWVFWINIPVGIIVMVLAPALLTESRDRARARSFDVAGALAVTLALVLLVYAITDLPSAGWASRRSVGPLVAVAALAVVFALIEKRSAAPLMPPRVFRSRTLVGGNLLILTAGMAVDGMLITLTAHTQQVLGWSATRFGLVASAMTLTAVTGSLAGQRWATRLGVRPVAAVATILLGCGCLLLTLISAGGSPKLVLAALLIFGVGLGAAAVCSQIAALAGVAERDSGLAAGLVETAFAVGSSLGVAICASVTIARTSAAGRPTPVTVTSAQQAAFGVAALFAALGLVIALTLLGRRSTGNPSPEPADLMTTSAEPGATSPVRSDS